MKDLGKPIMPLLEPSVATKKATFGMSWFWFPEAEFGALKGVIRTRVGYAGGTSVKPTYYNLSDHTETVDVDYDPRVTDYTDLLAIFWSKHDPTVKCSRQYMSAIFYHDEEQKSLAESTMLQAGKERSKKITTQILPAKEFYEAEGYHQKYLLQQQGSLLLEALAIKPGKDLIKSHVAAKVNGYIGGYGSRSDFEEEYPALGLNDEMADYIRNNRRS